MEVNQIKSVYCFSIICFVLASFSWVNMTKKLKDSKKIRRGWQVLIVYFMTKKYGDLPANQVDSIISYQEWFWISAILTGISQHKIKCLVKSVKVNQTEAIYSSKSSCLPLQYIQIDLKIKKFPSYVCHTHVFHQICAYTWQHINIPLWFP